ncbi:hypothetical protein ACIQMR_30925 [Streptomyces sp. NPDC091376]|uniref:hypothetical protein n=1 Tax=Streptomyces sp. NPDC091376 TaxID=3365994 RepID=UPI00381A3BB4
MTPYIERQHDLVLATTMMTVGFGEPKIDGLLFAAGARLHDLQKVWLFQAKAWAPSSDLGGEDLTRLLLRTAEETAGLPCVSSGLLHRLEPTPPPVGPMSVIDGQHRLSALRTIVHHTMGSGKSATIVFEAMGQLSRRLDEIGRDGRAPTAADFAHLADAADALSALLLSIVQRRHDGYVRRFAYLVAVPLTESSPCGVLRLAAPRVPRAPGAGLVPGLSNFALAA